jgi:hypothetical protein
MIRNKRKRDAVEVPLQSVVDSPTISTSNSGERSNNKKASLVVKMNWNEETERFLIECWRRFV